MRAFARRCFHAAGLASALLLALAPALALARADAPARAPVAEPWAAEIAAFERADRAHPPEAGGIVFVGSSSIRKWTTLASDFPGLNAVNRGFGGSSIADSTRYAHRIVTPYRPRQVVLYAGDNDLAEGRSAAQVLSDFKDFVATVRNDLPDEPIAFISIKPSPSRAQLLPSVRAANALIADYARTQKGLTYIDVFTPMLDAHGQPRAELFIGDRLHMTRAGYVLWTSIISPHLK